MWSNVEPTSQLGPCIWKIFQMRYTILCILNGETGTFPVTLDETQTVHKLKKAVKEEHQQLIFFRAHHLNVDAAKEDWIAEVKRKARNLSGLQELALLNSLTFELSRPRLRTVHVLVQPGKGESCTGAELDAMLIPHSAKIFIFAKSRSKTV